jgi:restriction endonuclease S subunit
LEIYLHSRDAQQAIDRMKTGINDSGLNLTHGRFAELEVPLPPIREQVRVIEKLDEINSELDKCIESLGVAQLQIELLYQSILDNAFRGLEETKNLEDLIAQKLSNGYSGKPVKRDTKYKVLSLSATTSGTFNPANYKYLDESGLEARDIWCEPDDILVQRGNTIEYVGVPAIYTGASRQFIFPDLMIRVRAHKERIRTKYLYYALSSPRVRNRLRSKAKGSAGTMPKISQAILNDLVIPYCQMDRQDNIVADIEKRLSNCLFIANTIDEELRRVDFLRQSILSKVFSGRLVSQDPIDEPVSVLLERIRADKEAQAQKEKLRRARKKANKKTAKKVGKRKDAA